MKTMLTLLCGLGIAGMAMTYPATKSAEVTTVQSLATVSEIAAADGSEVIAIRYLTLKDGVEAAAFERFAVEEYVPAINTYLPGVRAWIAKGERGTNVGGYVLVSFFESLHTRNYYFPDPDAEEMSEASQMAVDASGGLLQEVTDELTTYTDGFNEYTDYVVIEPVGVEK